MTKQVTVTLGMQRAEQTEHKLPWLRVGVGAAGILGAHPDFCYKYNLSEF